MGSRSVPPCGAGTANGLNVDVGTLGTDRSPIRAFTLYQFATEVRGETLDAGVGARGAIVERRRPVVATGSADAAIVAADLGAQDLPGQRNRRHGNVRRALIGTIERGRELPVGALDVQADGERPAARSWDTSRDGLQGVEFALGPARLAPRVPPDDAEDECVRQQPERQRHQHEAPRHVRRPHDEADDQCHLREDRGRHEPRPELTFHVSLARQRRAVEVDARVRRARRRALVHRRANRTPPVILDRPAATGPHSWPCRVLDARCLPTYYLSMTDIAVRARGCGLTRESAELRVPSRLDARRQLASRRRTRAACVEAVRRVTGDEHA